MTDSGPSRRRTGLSRRYHPLRERQRTPRSAAGSGTGRRNAAIVELSQTERKARPKGNRTDLKARKVTGVMAILEHYREALEAVYRCLDCYRANRTRMRYGEYRSVRQKTVRLRIFRAPVPL